MSGLGRAIAVLGAVSVIGTATQVAKGKLGALFLGASGVGVLSQLTLLYGLLAIIAGLGFFNGMMRHIALAVKDGDRRQARAQMNSVTLFLGGSSLIITAICLGLSEHISDLLFGDDGARAALVSLVVIAVPIAVQQRIFRAYLNATRDLKGISRAQTGADITSVAIFAICAWQFGIWGAAISFVAMHALLLLGLLVFSVRSGGIGLALPNPKHFRWKEIIPNFGFGINGLILTAASTVSAIIIARMIIALYGLADAGAFSVAWKVATVYLGALYAAAGSYYFPTLVRLDSTQAIEEEANRAVALYMTILPPLMAGLIVFGDLLIPIMFSREFLPAVVVMAGLLFGDIFRVTSETMGLTLLARRHLIAYSGVHLMYATGFVGASWWLLPEYGLPGIAYAYICMQMINFAMVLAACRLSFGMKITATGMRPFVLAILTIAPLVIAQSSGLNVATKSVFAALLGAVWLFANWRTHEMEKVRERLLKRLRTV